MSPISRAKFACLAVTKRKYYGGFLFEYEFMAVTDGSEENKSFFASTPSGSLKLGAVRNDVFIPGESYYLDFTLYTPPPPSDAAEAPAKAAA